MGTNSRKAMGVLGEKVAARYLREKGFSIIAENYRTGHGEIDLIAKEGPYLVFVEVRTRSSRAYGSPVESIDTAKINRIRKTAMVFLEDYMQPEGSRIRFDFLSLEVKKNIMLGLQYNGFTGRRLVSAFKKYCCIEHIKNAF